MAIGAVTSTGRPVDVAEITRLDHRRDLLPDSWVPAPPRLLVFSRAGFTSDARRPAGKTSNWSISNGSTGATDTAGLHHLSLDPPEKLRC